MASHRRRRKLGRQCAWCGRDLMTDDATRSKLCATDVPNTAAMFWWHAACYRVHEGVTG